MTPEQDRTVARKGRLFARKGHVIFHACDGKLGEAKEHFTRELVIDKQKVTVPAINAAKRWVRDHARQTTFVVR